MAAPRLTGRRPALLREDSVERTSRARALNAAEAGGFEKSAVFGKRALPAFGADQHVERLHVGGRGAGLVVGKQLFSDEERASFGQAGVDLLEQARDFFLGPIVQDAPGGVEVGFS